MNHGTKSKMCLIYNILQVPIAIDSNSTVATLMTASEMYNVGLMTNSELCEVFIDLLGHAVAALRLFLGGRLHHGLIVHLLRTYRIIFA